MSLTLSSRVAASSLHSQCQIQAGTKAALTKRWKSDAPALSAARRRLRELSVGAPKGAKTIRKGTTSSSLKGHHEGSYTVLKGRTVISLKGPDAADFLHNLIPAPVLPLTNETSCIATAFLNAKGRILHDAFVFKPTIENGDTWYLEVDANSAEAVVKHIEKHKLRSRFELKQMTKDEAAVFYLEPGALLPTNKSGLHTLQDPRPGMGFRGYLIGITASQNLKERIKRTGPEKSWEDHLIHRILNGHAEGPVEILSEHALPQESNLDLYGGIDFHKGCYLGQELTIRTHHTGVVRKRILPVQIYEDGNRIRETQPGPQYEPSTTLPQPPNEANISKCGASGRSGRSTGKWLGGYGNIGLALCRLETMTDLSLTAEGSQYDPANDEFEVTWQEGETGEEKKVKVKAFLPPWLREKIDESLKARTERSEARKRRDSEEDEDEVD